MGFDFFWFSYDLRFILFEMLVGVLEFDFVTVISGSIL